MSPSAAFCLPPHPDTPPDSIKALAILVARGEDLEVALVHLGLTNESINGWLHHPSWMQLIKENLVPDEEVETRLRTLVPEALRVKEKLLRSSVTDAKTRNAIADDILDRTGFKSSESRERNIFVINPEMVAHFLSSLAKPVIDVTSSSDE